MRACDTSSGAIATRRTGQRRWLALVLLLVAGALLSSGCITLRLTNEFAADGSGAKRLVFAVDSDLVDMMKSAASELGTPTPQQGSPATPDDLFADLRSQASAVPGAQVLDYEDPATKRKGLEVVVPFANLQEHEALAQSDMFKDLERIQVSESDHAVTVKSRFNPEAADTSGQTKASDFEQQFGQALVEKLGFDFAYAVVVPGRVVDWGPQDIGTAVPRTDGTTEITWRGDISKPWPEIWVTWVPE